MTGADTDGYQFLDREEVEFTYHSRLYRYWFFFRDTGITYKRVVIRSENPERPLHPDGEISDVTEAVIILYRTATSGDLPVQGMISKLLGMLLRSYESQAELKRSLKEGIEAFDSTQPIANIDKILKFVKPFVSWKVPTLEETCAKSAAAPEKSKAKSKAAESSGKVSLQSLRDILTQPTRSPSELGALPNSSTPNLPESLPRTLRSQAPMTPEKSGPSKPPGAPCAKKSASRGVSFGQDKYREILSPTKGVTKAIEKEQSEPPLVDDSDLISPALVATSDLIAPAGLPLSDSMNGSAGSKAASQITVRTGSVGPNVTLRSQGPASPIQPSAATRSPTKSASPRSGPPKSTPEASNPSPLNSPQSTSPSSPPNSKSPAKQAISNSSKNPLQTPAGIILIDEAPVTDDEAAMSDDEIVSFFQETRKSLKRPRSADRSDSHQSKQAENTKPPSEIANPISKTLDLEGVGRLAKRVRIEDMIEPRVPVEGEAVDVEMSTEEVSPPSRTPERTSNGESANQTGSVESNSTETSTRAPEKSTQQTPERRTPAPRNSASPTNPQRIKIKMPLKGNENRLPAAKKPLHFPAMPPLPDSENDRLSTPLGNAGGEDTSMDVTAESPTIDPRTQASLAPEDSSIADPVELMKAWQREEIRIREMDTDRYNRRMEISIARIQSIKDQNTTLRRERDELQNSLNEVPKIAAATQAKHENQIKALKADAKICKDNNYFLQQSNDKLDAQLREREKESKELEHFKKELRETVSNYEKLQKRHDDTKKDLQATLTELRDERLQCRRTADVVKTLKHEKETVVKEKLKFESTLRTKNEELWGLRKKVQEMERLKARSKQAEEEVKVARKSQEEAEEKIRKLQERLRKRESFAQELLKQRERERAILGQMAGEDAD